MSDIIRILPESIANQIAAGEVVQRPASVVKELVENAVDAGSTSVTVSIVAGGRESIQVVDNGKGMSAGDAVRAFQRHATSKIDRADDLYNLMTFGFRGEALASIASVSEVELRTRRPEDEIGIRLLVEAGQVTGPQPANLREGSQFTVKNLFYNVPARRKFLKSKSVETKHVVDEFLRIALCHPEIEMALYDNDTCRYQLAATKRRQRIVQIFGRHINGNLLEVNVDTSIIRIKGFIGNPQAAKKSGSSEQFLFVNNRYFRSPYFHKAIMQAYEKLIQNDVYPSYFLYMEVDPSRIDVNIHPTKTEVKFEDEQAVWQIVNAAVRESLGKFGAVPLMDFDTEEPIEIPVMGSGRSGVPKMPVSSLNPDFNPFESENRPMIDPIPSPSARGGGYLSSMSYHSEDSEGDWQELYRESYDSFDKNSTEGDTFRNFILGEDEGKEPESFSDLIDIEDDDPEQEIESEAFYDIEPQQGTLAMEESFTGKNFLRLTRRHIVATIKGRCFVLNLGRIRQRVLYERFLHTQQEGQSVNQQELFPEPLALSPQEKLLLTEIRDDLLRMGFDLGEDGNGELVIRGVPAEWCEVPASKLIDSLLANLKEQEPLPDRRMRIAAAMARTCGKATDQLTDDEIVHLIGMLFACSEPAYSPSGKKTFFEITEDEIYKRLK